MRLDQLVIYSTICLVLMSSLTQAEIVTIDVAVKEIDSKERIITVATKSKEIKLEVGKNAKILISGEESTLDSVKAGQTATVSYESSLEIVTKIEVTNGSKDKPSSNKVTPAISYAISMVGVSIDAQGNGLLIVDTRSPEIAHAENQEAKGTPVTIPVLGDAKAFKHEDGQLTAVYDFANIKSLSGVKPLSEYAMKSAVYDKFITLDKDENALIVKPNPENNLGCLPFPRTVSGPFECKLNLAGLNGGSAFPTFRAKSGTLQIGLNGSSSSKGVKARTVTVHLSRPNENIGKGEELVNEPLPQGQRKGYEFKIKPEFVAGSVFMQVNFRLDGPVAVPRFELTGRLNRWFGFGSEKKGNRIVVTAVVKDQAAAEAGLKEGDIILAINGEKVDDASKISQLLSATSIDEDIVFEIERFGRTRKIVVKSK